MKIRCSPAVFFCFFRSLDELCQGSKLWGCLQRENGRVSEGVGEDPSELHPLCGTPSDGERNTDSLIHGILYL